MYVIVVYDITEVKKQLKIRNFLRRFLNHIQFSVFHGNLNPSQLKEIELFLKDFDYEGNDSVVVFIVPIYSNIRNLVFGRNIEKSNII
ncbi:MAG: CRISPR-associated endonuclease Cas2 [Candidatus Micrarchaeia archaeon]